MATKKTVKQRAINPNDHFNTLVQGVGKKNADGTSRQKIIKECVGKGHVLDLKREPNNPTDPNTIGIWWGKYQLGYLGDYLTEGVAKLMDTGHPVCAIVTEAEPEDEEDNFVNVYFTLSTGTDAQKALAENAANRKSCLSALFS